MKLWLIFLFSLSPTIVFAAACCGGGFSSASLISGDDQAQLSSSYSMTEVAVDNVDSEGLWHKWDTHQKVQTFKLDGAFTFFDLWQAGLSIPVIQRSRLNENYSGLGDVSTSLGYEYLPDWNYNPWRPKGVGYLQVTLPTGKSKADSDVGGLDSRGNGFWALGIGTLLTKNWSRYDASVSAEIHRSFEKHVSSSQFQGRLQPGYGSNFGFGLGYNVKDYRLGTGITWTYEDPVQMNSDNGNNNSGSVERYATAQLSVSYLAIKDWSGTISYTDQTLFGSPINTSLGRGVALALQRRWNR